MSRINTNVPSLISQRVLGANNKQLNSSLERLSTGLKINSGADNPAGLIASENLRAEKLGLAKAVDNAERASNIIGTAEGGLAEVSALLSELQSLVTETASSGGLSDEEIDANQQQVDSILNTINRLAGSVQFNGKKLLDGSLAYTTSGVLSGQVKNVRLNSARILNDSLSVTVNVTASAQLATVNYTGGTLSAAATIQVTGRDGTEQITFNTGATISGMQTSINALTDLTGVSATVSGSNLVFTSTEYGSDEYVTVRAVTGTFTLDTTGIVYGEDATVDINGQAAEVDGLMVKGRTAQLDIEFSIAEAFNAENTSSFTITGGGANFQLGSKVNVTNQKSIGINAVTTAELGNSTLGFLNTLASGHTNSLTGDNISDAQKIVDKAIQQVSQLRGRLGAFQKYEIGSTVNALGVAYENISAAESAIRDTDFAEETANLTRAQILSAASQSILAQANAQPQSALQLLQ